MNIATPNGNRILNIENFRARILNIEFLRSRILNIDPSVMISIFGVVTSWIPHWGVNVEGEATF